MVKGTPMLVIAILLLLSLIATAVALIAASPLFRTISLVIDSWADELQGSGGRELG
jgi:biopolymer transport protein ExbB/TolQ